MSIQNMHQQNQYAQNPHNVYANNSAYGYDRDVHKSHGFANMHGFRDNSFNSGKHQQN